MLKTVKDVCTLQEGTLDYREVTDVENLAEIIHDSGDRGQTFFQRNYLTRGMEQLLRKGLLRLSGQTGQALFELAQAMGGGKTHLMSAPRLSSKGGHGTVLASCIGSTDSVLRGLRISSDKARHACRDIYSKTASFDF